MIRRAQVTFNDETNVVTIEGDITLLNVAHYATADAWTWMRAGPMTVGPVTLQPMVQKPRRRRARDKGARDKVEPS